MLKIILLLAVVSFSREFPVNECRTVDGDTFECVIDLGFGVQIKEVIRLLNADTHETSLIRGTTPKQKVIGRKAKKYVHGLMTGAKKIIIDCYGKGKYGRRLCLVFVDGVDLGEDLTKKGFTRD